MSHIPLEQYKQIIEVLPILCVDVVIRNTHGQFFLVKRVNAPKKGQWWVIGGRVLKGETLEQAAARKVLEEIGLEATTMQPIGYFETVADANPFNLPFDYHADSVVFQTMIDQSREIKLDHQSVAWMWADALPADFHIRSFQEV